MDTSRKNFGNFAKMASEKLGVPMEELEEFLTGYMDMQVMYRSAIRDVRTRLEILDDEFQYRNKRNPIHSIRSRLKTPQSMLDKLSRRGLTPSLEVMKTQLTDIAGIRVVCPYQDDIYYLADLLCTQQNVELLRSHDYIKKPKPNGYRSLHIVVTVPVHFSDGMHQVPVEVQIRTIAMDFWASLEHELRYKSAAKIPQALVRELRDCADCITELDERMQRVYLQMEDIEGKTAP